MNTAITFLGNCFDTMRSLVTSHGQEVALIASAIVGAYVATTCAMEAFFRQKEFELVHKRYLEDGVDRLVDATASALHLLQHGYTRCFLILKTYRDLKKDTPKNIYSDPFPKPDANSFLSTKHFLLQQLIRDSVFYDVAQLMLVFMHDAFNTFENDLCTAIRVQVEGGKGQTIKPEQRTEMIDMYAKHLAEIEQEARPYWIMLGKLQSISFVLERERFTFKALKRFHKNKTVRSCITDVTKLFAKALEEAREFNTAPTIASSVCSARGGPRATEA